MHGLIVAISGFVSLLAFLLLFVAASYALNVATGQSLLLCGKLVKKNSAISFSGFDCSANFVGLKSRQPPRGCSYRLNRRSRLVRSLDLLGLVRASNIVSFMDRSFLKVEGSVVPHVVNVRCNCVNIPSLRVSWLRWAFIECPC